MNIRDYTANFNTDSDKKSTFEDIKNSKEFKDIERDYGSVVEDFVNNYADKSEPELMQDLLKLVAQKKREGTFDIQQLRNMAEMIAPMLDEEQRAKMFNLLNFLD